jgi:phosphatidate cytidylyltransferase
MVFIPVWMFLFLPARMTIAGHTDGFLRAVGTLSWGLMITVFALSHTALILKFGVNHGIGAGALLFLVALTQFNDVAQFTCGKLLGRHKIIPRVSPKKTWEGFLGGVMFTTAAGALVGPDLTPMTTEWSAVAGFLIAISGFLGDVTISACKRDLGVKDASNLIPGHGGILDRVDSLIYSAPVFFHFMNYFFGNWPANPL